VLVGHSFAGTIISGAGIDPKVAALVYVARTCTDAGEDYTALAMKFPRPPASDGLVTSGGFAQLNEESFPEVLRRRVDPVKARILYAVQGTHRDLAVFRSHDRRAWRSKPAGTRYSANDKTSRPNFSAHGRPHESQDHRLASSHVSLISHPQESLR